MSEYGQPPVYLGYFNFDLLEFALDRKAPDVAIREAAKAYRDANPVPAPSLDHAQTAPASAL